MSTSSGYEYKFFGTYLCEVHGVFHSDLDQKTADAWRAECPSVGIGWLKVKAPAFMGSEKFLFARPKSPFSGADGIGMLLLPTRSWHVLISFLGGSSGSYPMWEHCGWVEKLGASPPDSTEKRRILFIDEDGSEISVSREDDKEEAVIKIKGIKRVRIEAAGEVDIVAEKNANITAGGDIIVKADGDTAIRGANVFLN